jgi:hypothetical protein
VSGRGQRLAAGWFLGAVFAAFVVFAWLRGLGRFLIPALLLAACGYGVMRVVRKIREPLP